MLLMKPFVLAVLQLFAFMYMLVFHIELLFGTLVVGLFVGILYLLYLINKGADATYE